MKERQKATRKWPIDRQFCVSSKVKAYKLSGIAQFYSCCFSLPRRHSFGEERLRDELKECLRGRLLLFIMAANIKVLFLKTNHKFRFDLRN